ncbi:MAG: FadR/GntR family transcriptional regulator [Dehalococcoidia bacterium]
MDHDTTLFASIITKRNFEQVAAEIKRLIYDGTLTPGDRLPSEARLAEQFNVGRQTVREAIRILELSGLVVVKRGSNGGAFISEMISDKLHDLFMDALRFNHVSLEEVTIARLELERIVATHAINSATEEDMKKLLDNVNQARSRIANNQVATSLNVEFHNILAAASKNHVFILVIRTLMDVVEDLLLRLKPDIAASEAVVEEHQEIVDALADKNLTKSILLLEKHLLGVKARLDYTYKK